MNSRKLQTKDLIGVVSELRGNLEPLDNFCYKIWSCEVLKGIIIDEGIFIRNAKGFLFPRIIQTYLRSLFKTNGDCPIILSTNKTEASDCAAYVKWFPRPGETRKSIK